MTKLLKVVLVLMIISIISITPQAFAQISFGTPAEHVSIGVTIEENGDVHIVHVVKKSDENVQVKMLPGTIENLLVVDGAGNEIQHAMSGHSIITLFPPKVNFGVEYDLKDVLILKDGVWTCDYLYTESKNGVEFYFPDEFDIIFKSGDEVAIKRMLDEHTWLLDEVSGEMDNIMMDQRQVIAALGVMEDELGAAVPIDEIIFSLRVDFSIRKPEDDVNIILNGVENLGLVKRDFNGWILTSEGGRTCDDYLNRNLENIEF